MPCQDLGHQRETTSLITLGSGGNLFHKPTRLLGSGDFLVFRFFLKKKKYTVNIYLLPIQGPQDDSKAIFWPHFGILNNFPHFL